MFVFLSNFVCPLTGAHTNGVERTWRPMKRYFSIDFPENSPWCCVLRMFRNARSVSLEQFDSYLYSWLFRYNLERSGMRDDQIFVGNTLSKHTEFLIFREYTAGGRHPTPPHSRAEDIWFYIKLHSILRRKLHLIPSHSRAENHIFYLDFHSIL